MGGVIVAVGVAAGTEGVASVVVVPVANVAVVVVAGTEEVAAVVVVPGGVSSGGSIRKASLFFGGGLGVIVAVGVAAGTEGVAAVVVVPGEVFSSVVVVVVVSFAVCCLVFG